MNLPIGITGKGSLSEKPHIIALNPALLLEVGRAFRYGAEKHGLNNFRRMTPDASQYLMDAALRHLYQYLDGEHRADDSGVHHLAHVVANISMLYRLIDKYGDAYTLDEIIMEKI